MRILDTQGQHMMIQTMKMYKPPASDKVGMMFPNASVIKVSVSLSLSISSKYPRHSRSKTTNLIQIIAWAVSLTPFCLRVPKHLFCDEALRQ